MGALIARLYAAIVPIGEISSGGMPSSLLSRLPDFSHFCFNNEHLLPFVVVRRSFCPNPTRGSATRFDRWLIASLFALPATPRLLILTVSLPLSPPPFPFFLPRPPDKHERDERIVDVQDLTRYERSLRSALMRVSVPIFAVMCAFIGVAVHVYGKDEDATNFGASVLAFIPILPQLLISMRVGFCSAGLSLNFLQAYKVCICFFILLNTVRIFTRLSVLQQSCSLDPSSFSNKASAPSADACSGAISIAETLLLLVYAVFSLLKLAIAGRLEVCLERRAVEASGVGLLRDDRLTQMDADRNNLSPRTTDQNDRDSSRNAFEPIKGRNLV